MNAGPIGREGVDARRIGQAERGDTLQARTNRLKAGDVVRARIRRHDPAAGAEPYYETFEVPYEKWMRVLDVLIYVQEELESDVSFRWYCGSKMCGTCAMRVNGREVLACWEPAQPEMTIEPLRNFPLRRDLTVDRAAYERRILGLHPWLERRAPYAGFPEPLAHGDIKLASKALDCISCGACYSACPVVGLGEVTRFAGPAPLVQLAQKALDPRDGRDRAIDIADAASIFDCVSCYRCEEVCPSTIPIVSGVIEPMKAIVYRRRGAAVRHAHAVLEIVKKRGRIDPAELVLRVQGLRALRNAGRVLRLLLAGKIRPLRTLFGRPIPKISDIRRVFERANRG
jgi:succinate dehydrogenase/fumarate reductase iron-sulfur protein